MQVDEATVRHIARLARIKINEQDAKNLEQELTAILDWVEQLGEVDTSAVEPMTRIGGTRLKQREDVVTDGGYPDAIVRNTPMADDHFFVVPKVVE